jgi:hypothetical protein
MTLNEIRKFHEKVKLGIITGPGTVIEQVYHTAVGVLLTMVDGKIDPVDSNSVSTDL